MIALALHDDIVSNLQIKIKKTLTGSNSIRNKLKLDRHQHHSNMRYALWSFTITVTMLAYKK